MIFSFLFFVIWHTTRTPNHQHVMSPIHIQVGQAEGRRETDEARGFWSVRKR